MAVTCPACQFENPDGARFCAGCGNPLDVRAPAREVLKTVTVVFCDVTGSTALGERLDPESLRHVMARYFEAMRAVIERHGGTVEKFIGDAVMAVFGVPAVHEDDALRAVRAATEMREALAGLNEQLEDDYGTRLEMRVGVNTGEVVVGTEERLATGDAVNVAARLEQAAAPSEVLLGPETMRLLRGAVTAEKLEPLELKGKAEGVLAFRLVSLDAKELRRRVDAPMIGRQRELRLLGDAWERAGSERACVLFTLLGVAGVGKSRLTEEFLAEIDATLVRGRCLSYGEGITYWPVTEIVLQLDQLGQDVSAGPLAGLLGEGPPTSSEEIALAFRRLLEQAAAERTLLVLFDDLHWGEPALLDLVEHVATMSRGAPILLLCLGRPELLDRRQAWGGGLLNATTVLLEPLSAPETEELIATLGSNFDEELAGRIRDAAGGNPLFVEEMTAMVAEGGGGEVVVPPTVQALLAARLDQLDGDERSVLERGAVEGQVFHRGAVQALGAVDDVSPRLSALVRKELVRPEVALFSGDDAYRFRHILIRDAAYDALPKATRAELHERFADWLEEHGADLLERDEILGYHLEQAYRYRVELGPVGDAERALATRAAERLAFGAESARLRGDAYATGALLTRRAQLLPEVTVARTQADLELARVLFDTGDFDRAAQLVDDATRVAQQLGDERLAALAQLERLMLGTMVGGLDSGFDPAELERPTQILERLGDEIGQAHGLAYVGRSRFYTGDSTGALRAYERASELARRHGLRRDLRDWQRWEAAARYYGTTSASEALAFQEELLAEDAREGVPSALTELLKGALLAMTGEIAAGRRLVREAIPVALELGLVPFGMVGMAGGHVELLGGAPEAAVELLMIPWGRYGELGERGFRATTGTMLAEALLLVGRDAEAEAVLDEVETFAATDDFDPQARGRWVRALILSRRGELDEAERLAREAVAIVSVTDYLEVTADAYGALAQVLEATGRMDEARTQWRQALELYERKGVVPRIAQVREHLAA
jgi:class 3 adenylate cyclase/tetratricopeptide (TPR) repeat protein